MNGVCVGKLEDASEAIREVLDILEDDEESVRDNARVADKLDKCLDLLDEALL